jgi:hypothetical protein
MRCAVPLAIVACLGACMFDENADDRDQLQLVLDDQPLALPPQGSLVLDLIVVGDDGEPVAISAPELPPFATLTGARLELAPIDEDVGEYDIPLTVSDGERSDTEILHVRVAR